MTRQTPNNECGQSDRDESFDYSNTGWPRDFDIRIEVAEQQEVITPKPDRELMHCSDYDF